MEIQEIITELRVHKRIESVCTGTNWINGVGAYTRPVVSPVDGAQVGKVCYATETEYEAVLKRSVDAFQAWRNVPAPQRGELVRQMGQKLREHKSELGALVSYEMGKSLQEGLGEVQEMIDICDYAVGLSRQLYGFTMHSERPQHRMYEQWQPIGPVAVISSFNFPVAVWSWNAMIALVCGNTCIWKPSEKTPLSAAAVFHILEDVLLENQIEEGVITLINGGAEVGRRLAEDRRVQLLSATGSTAMGRDVAQKVAARLGRVLLELGGNNALIVSKHAQLDKAVRAIVFSAVGTAGQRCTSLRRLIVHESVLPDLLSKLLHAYNQIQIGSPLNSQNHMGPLIDRTAVEHFVRALVEVQQEGGELLCGGEVLQGAGFESGCYVTPALVKAHNSFKTVQKETFAPIVYVMSYKHFNEAIAMQNDVPQGLSSALFSDHLQETETFLSAVGSDCGIANVNMGTSGAEIGGAFGGEKDTGGGRESGSDSWKAYMRRQTVTVNYSNQMPLAQGIQFDL